MWGSWALTGSDRNLRVSDLLLAFRQPLQPSFHDRIEGMLVRVSIRDGTSTTSLILGNPLTLSMCLGDCQNRVIPSLSNKLGLGLRVNALGQWSCIL